MWRKGKSSSVHSRKLASDDLVPDGDGREQILLLLLLLVLLLQQLPLKLDPAVVRAPGAAAGRSGRRPDGAMVRVGGGGRGTDAAAHVELGQHVVARRLPGQRQRQLRPAQAGRQGGGGGGRRVVVGLRLRRVVVVQRAARLVLRAVAAVAASTAALVQKEALERRGTRGFVG